MIREVLKIARRECSIIRREPTYWFCLAVFPVLIIVFFTSLMMEGVPANMPVGIVDLDHTATSRAMVRQLDAFQTTQVEGYYNSAAEATKAIRSDKIFAFLYIPKGTTRGIMNGDRPTVTLFYSNVNLVAGSLTFRDLKTITTLGSAKVGITKLSAIGKSATEIKSFLQPITLDVHLLSNPYTNYNVYLSTTIMPGVFMVFVFLLVPYSLGTELKFKRSRQLMRLAGNNVYVAVAGKLLPQFLVFLTLFYAMEFYLFYVLGFPHPGGVVPMLLLAPMIILAGEGFGIFVFGLMPSLRMSMSICSLWAVVSFSLFGGTFPLTSMSPFFLTFAQLFPLRHYYMIYQMCILNGFPLTYAFWHFMALLGFILMPLLSMFNIKKAMLVYVYIP